MIDDLISYCIRAMAYCFCAMVTAGAVTLATCWLGWLQGKVKSLVPVLSIICWGISLTALAFSYLRPCRESTDP